MIFTTYLDEKFHDLRKKYFEVSECMMANTREVSDGEGPITMRFDDTKLDRLTLVRWLHGSSSEFLADYQRKMAKVIGFDSVQKTILVGWETDLQDKMNEMKHIMTNK